MQRVIAVLCAGVALAATVVATSVAATVPATVLITGTEQPDASRVTVRGLFDSAAKCRANREVKAFSRYGVWTDRRHVWAPGPWERAGMLRSAADGSFAATVARPTLWSVKFRADPVKRGRRDCAGGKAALRFELG